RRLLRHDAAGPRATLRGRHLGVLLDPVDALDEHAVAVGVHREHLALDALVLACDDDDVVTLLDPHRQSTSGANEMMRMNRLSRRSLATGPKMRDPRGSRPSLRSTAALSSKRT